MLDTTEKLILATQRIAQLEADLQRARAQLEALWGVLNKAVMFHDLECSILNITPGPCDCGKDEIDVALESTGAQSDTEANPCPCGHPKHVGRCSGHILIPSVFASPANQCACFSEESRGPVERLAQPGKVGEGAEMKLFDEGPLPGEPMSSRDALKQLSDALDHLERPGNTDGDAERERQYKAARGIARTALAEPQSPTPAERAGRLYEALSAVADDVCGILCPSQWQIAEGRPPCHPKCQSLRAALSGAQSDTEQSKEQK